ncbi:HD domain-containing phosphohydrolase [Vibrio gazogenes]|uniref:Response regulator c-di-GMP phosphodiesterase, RpfG family, contains REC and HD-GYP domains n=3 Tax=Vibrio gazogenes TaxID=687 RepID=A0A1M4WIV1_VIBGA|nr:HD domain-containing phosphohydrolase [Vibrio gazogenes]USP13211.1 DUF3369 domain-containing protein [Vibrio gazogenes]SHE81221.1 Response regulator c-di-GMP phosphodiesterase, RpfG family, contains REC and HD-GYP domains [Vibrio gazogenes DSM 21264] [Vibrio gazogenes DSM 21264 = NBRC 103151]
MSEQDMLFDESGNLSQSSQINTCKDEPSRWKILIVDDEDGMHTITKLALNRTQFDGKGLIFFSAYNVAQAKEILSSENDIAVVLLDVVMETEEAGLEVAEYIRDVQGNHLVRIILRTGQPGTVPEKDIIEQYDINDYREKTELTKRKLHSTVYTAIRSYRDISALENHKLGLEKVIGATANILKHKSMDSFAQDVLEQVSSLLYMKDGTMLSEIEGGLAEKNIDDIHVLAQIGDISTQAFKASISQENFNVARDSDQALHYQEDNIYHISNINGVETILNITGKHQFKNVDMNLIAMFCNNMAIALDNLRLNDSLRNTQKEIVYAICGLAESRSKETGNHVRRVAYYSRLMAEELGLSPAQCEEIFYAAPLHDIGKISIPDYILNKPGKLNDEERTLMKKHTTVGENCLKGSHQPVMQAGAIIASQHHECWNGLGYPRGLSGTDIHIYGRIVALADVFDALASRRCYKEPWGEKEIVTYIHKHSGETFDPQLVDIFERRQADFFRILQEYDDSQSYMPTV